MTNATALEKARELCQFAHEGYCETCNRIAAALKRAWAAGCSYGGPEDAVAQIQARQARKEADQLAGK